LPIIKSPANTKVNINETGIESEHVNKHDLGNHKPLFLEETVATEDVNKHMLN